MSLQEMTRTDQSGKEQEFDVKKSFLADLPEAKNYNETEVTKDYEEQLEKQKSWERERRKAKEMEEYYYPMRSDF